MIEGLGGNFRFSNGMFSFVPFVADYVHHLFLVHYLEYLNAQLTGSCYDTPVQLIINANI